VVGSDYCQGGRRRKGDAHPRAGAWALISESQNPKDGSDYYLGMKETSRERSTTFSQMVDRGDIMASEHANSKIILVMVGLPGRGKSFISRKIELFLSWAGQKTRVRVVSAP
jgi:Mrp family chromosome partitioning ATPase